MHVHTVIQSGLLLIKNKTNNNKHVICQLYTIEVKSNPKQCGPPKNAVVKKDVKSKVAAKKWL